MTKTTMLVQTGLISLGTLFAVPALAATAPTWEQVNGCATSISVGPDDVPVVTGCGSSGDNEIYWGQEQCNGFFCNNYQWHSSNFSAHQVQVNLDGDFWATTSSGLVYELEHNDSGPWFGPIEPSKGGCLTSIAVPAQSPAAYENDPAGPASQCPAKGGTIQTLWGLGCGGSAHTVFSWFMNLNTCNVTAYDKASSWMGVGSNAKQVALFTYPGQSNYQVPWMLDTNGNIWEYSGGGWTQKPGGAYWLTDHHVAAWPAVFKWDDPSGTWKSVVSILTPNNTYITQIAYSESITLSNGTVVGPSRLWGVDQNGAIYYAIFPDGSPVN
jgi:hypothetical protein